MFKCIASSGIKNNSFELFEFVHYLLQVIVVKLAQLN